MSATVDTHHYTVCPVCWLDRETRYADDEYRRHGGWPVGLTAPVDTLLEGLSQDFEQLFLRHFQTDDAVSPQDIEVCIEVAEYIAGWRYVHDTFDGAGNLLPHVGIAAVDELDPEDS